MMSRRKFSKEFKLAAVRRIQAGEPVPYLARGLEVNPSDLYRWHREAQQLGEGAFVGAGQRQVEQDRAAELERKIGQQALEIDFLKGCLQRIDEQRKLQALAGKPLSTSRSKAKGRGAQP